MRIQLLLTIVFICLFISLGCGSKSNSNSNHRISEDKTEEILYLFDDVAIIGMVEKNDMSTTEGMLDKTFYDLVIARWLNEPTMVCFTGDEVLRTFVNNIQWIGYDSQLKVVYGAGYLFDDISTEPPYKFREESFFILFNGQSASFQNRQSMEERLRSIGVSTVTLRPPVELFLPYKKHQTK